MDAVERAPRFAHTPRQNRDLHALRALARVARRSSSARAADADLMFVGEAPGFHEDQQGVRSSGRRGSCWTGCSRIGLISRRRVRRERPQVPPAREPRPQPDEIAACEPHLFRQIEPIQPQLVATLGNFATKLLSGKPAGITRVHGHEQEVTLGGADGAPVPDLHPAAALYTPSMLKVLEEDFARIPALLERTVDDAAADEPWLRRSTPIRNRSTRFCSAGLQEVRMGSPAKPTPLRTQGARVLARYVADRGRRHAKRLQPRRRMRRSSWRDPLACASSSPAPRRARPSGSRGALAPRLRARATSSPSPASSAPARRPSCAARAGRSGRTTPVTSPTFTIGHRYAGRVVSASRPLPLRRVSAEWVTSSRISTTPVVFVEWPKRACRALPSARLAVTLEHAGERSARIVLAADESALLDKALRAPILAFDTATDVATSALLDGTQLLARAHRRRALAARGRRRAAGGRGARARATWTRSSSAPAPAASRARGSAWPLRGASASPSAFPAPESQRSTPSLPRDRLWFRSSTPAAARCSLPARASLAGRSRARAGGALRRQRRRPLSRDPREPGRSVPPDADDVHVPHARLHAALAADFGPVEEIEPVYVRLPDAEAATA